MPTPNQAESSPDRSPLWYRDPTGAQVVRNLEPGPYQIISPNGFRIWIALEDLKPLLQEFAYQQSRKGYIWAKKNALAATNDQGTSHIR